MLELNKLYNLDCMDGMAQIPDKYFDAVITDPPYKMNHSTGGCTNIGFREKWQGRIKAGNTVMGFDTSIKFAQWLPEVYRVLKDDSHCYVFTNDKNMRELLNEADNCKFRLSNILVWRKNNCTPNRYYMKNGELVVFFYKGKATPIHNMSSKTVIDCDNIRGVDKSHATEKPVSLIEGFINNSTQEGQSVFDPFMGSGTTAIASMNTGRNFMGFELDKDCCEAAQERMRKHFAQGSFEIPTAKPSEQIKF